MAPIPKRCTNTFCERFGSATNRAHSSKQPMQQPIKHIASAAVNGSWLDRHILSFLWGACASVASCLNTIGRNKAYFTLFLADGSTRALRCCARDLWRCRSSRKTCLHIVVELQPLAAIMPSCRFCRFSAWLLAASSKV